MLTRILALVVLYKSTITNSPTLRTLRNIGGTGLSVNVLIWDNSPERSLNSEDLLQLGQGVESVEYQHHPENVPLSFLYNVVIREQLSDDEYLLLLDQDSLIPSGYGDAIQLALSNYPRVDLFLPVVRAHGQIVSPATFCCGWGRYWKSYCPGLVVSRRTVAINSCMLISGAYVRGQFSGYDERLAFYGTDTFFMLAYARARKNFVLLPVEVPHDLSFYSASDVVRLEKFKEIWRANKVIYSQESTVIRVLAAGVAFVFSIIYAARYRNLEYLRRKR